MPRLVSPAGSVVNVSEEKAARLGSGWVPYVPEKPQPEPKPTTRRAKKK